MQWRPRVRHSAMSILDLPLCNVGPKSATVQHRSWVRHCAACSPQNATMAFCLLWLAYSAVIGFGRRPQLHTKTSSERHRLPPRQMISFGASVPLPLKGLLSHVSLRHGTDSNSHVVQVRAASKNNTCLLYCYSYRPT